MSGFGDRRESGTVYVEYAFREDETVDVYSLTQIWPGWSVVREIGSGSYGKVYEIHRRNGGWLEKAAMKVIRVPANPAEMEQLRMDGMTNEDTETYLARHVEEIRTEIGLMQHFVGNSNIVSYEDYSIRKHVNGIGWDILIRMELLQTLPNYMSTHRFSESDVIRLGLDISQALILCHRAGIIHRDIKPQNIFINEHGFFKLGDFGISRIQPGTGSVMSFKGTLAYMAPETFAMRGTDARSDIYSLALVLYRILNGGREPFLNAGSEVSPEMIDAAQRCRLSGKPVPPPAYGNIALRQVLGRALAPDPAARYQTAVQFRNALQDAAAAMNAQTLKENRRHTLKRDSDRRFFQRVITGISGNRNTDRKKILIALLAVLSALLLFFGVWSLWDSRRNKSRQSEETVIAYGENKPDNTVAESLFREQEEESEKSAGSQDIPSQGENGKNTGTIAALQEPAAGQQGTGGSAGYVHSGDVYGDDGFNELEDFYENEDSELQEQDMQNTDSTVEKEGGTTAETVASESADPFDNPVIFADPALEKAIKEYLGITDRDISIGEARSIETLELSGKGKSQEDTITDLTGLEEFTGLTVLYLDENRISDLDALSGLTSLWKLHLESNMISDLSPIKELSGLKRLDLCHNQIENISLLEGFQKLEMLDIRENMVYDIEAVNGLINLKELYLSDNRISSIEPVRNLHGLTYLSMNNNPVNDLSPVADLDQLNTLCLSGCTQVDDIKVLEKLPSLTYLDIQGCSVSSDDSTLKKLKKRDSLRIKR